MTKILSDPFYTCFKINVSRYADKSMIKKTRATMQWPSKASPGGAAVDFKLMSLTANTLAATRNVDNRE